MKSFVISILIRMVEKFSFCLWVVVFTSIATLNAEAQSAAKPPIQNTYDSIMGNIEKVPGGAGLACLVKDFASIVEPGQYGNVKEVQEANSGLEAYYDKLADTDKTFAKQRDDFYAAIKNMSKPFGNTDSLNVLEAAGDANHKAVPSGWVWNLALKYSNGDSNRAMELIGVCGHDDYNSSHPDLCPQQGSVFYLNQGLGADTDISDELKKRIVGTSDLGCQRRNKARNECIPGKYYHVMGSASVACEMIKMGHDPLKVTALLEIAGLAYRSLWLTNLVEQTDNSGVTAISDKDLKLSNRVISFLQNKPAASCENEKNPNHDNSNKDPVLGDAVRLLKTWTVSSDHLKVDGSNMFTNFLNPEGELGVHDVTSSLVQPASWSKERYENARMKVKSILTDFIWTMEQHKVGAQFAAKVCKVDRKFKSNACSKK